MIARLAHWWYTLLGGRGLSMQTKLVAIFVLVKVIPLLLLTVVAWRQFVGLGETLRGIAVDDSFEALNESAIKNIERMSTDTANRVADFLYARDDDVRLLATFEPDPEIYARFLNTYQKEIVDRGVWALSADRTRWEEVDPIPPFAAGVSENVENNDLDGWHSIPRVPFTGRRVTIYDEITFVDPNGRELVKVVSDNSTKRNWPLSREKRDVSNRLNTYVKAETYFPELKKLKPGDIYVSDVIGAYVGANFIGLYTPGNVEKAAEARKYPIPFEPEKQAYAGEENPNGLRFEGIVRWATPVHAPDGTLRGYVTMALNHDHIMEFVDHLTPMDERYVKIPSGEKGNYAFIWDYLSRSICHPRHHSIVGFDPETGLRQIPMLETSIYDGWKASGLDYWYDYAKTLPSFHEQSRKKKPHPEIIRTGMVGLDGRYLNNAPQCIGWMNLTEGGGSGSFYILWSGLYKLNTAAAIPYYTGQYAPSAANGQSRRGFGFVAIGSDREFFTAPARIMGEHLTKSVQESMAATMWSLAGWTLALTVMVVVIAVWMAWNISAPIKSMARHLAILSTGDVAAADAVIPGESRHDEIGLLARSLRDLTDARRDELDMANAIAGGDYTRLLPLRSDADKLGQALNAMIRINKNALVQVDRAVKLVDADAMDVLEASESMSMGVLTSESELKAISGAVDTVDQQARENAETARGANSLAEAGRQAAKRGYEAVAQLAAAMAEIQQSGQKIASVAKLIDDIAFQTNLLALNAAVEAARAGRHGKGFSVVAEEVRNLSARSVKAAHETSDMVQSMMALMETGAQQARSSDQEFKDIVETSTQVANLFENIVLASNAQSSAMSEIVGRLEQIGEVTRDNSTHAERMASSAWALTRQSEALSQMVSHFQLGEGKERRRDQ